MGVASKAWRYSGGLVLNNLDFSIPQQQKPKQHSEKLHFYNCFLGWKWRPTVAVPWTVVCGLMLFAVGLISLFTGHVASDLEWYSQRLVKRTWYYKLVLYVFSFTPRLIVCLSLCVSSSSIFCWNMELLFLLRVCKKIMQCFAVVIYLFIFNY